MVLSKKVVFDRLSALMDEYQTQNVARMFHERVSSLKKEEENLEFVFEQIDFSELTHSQARGIFAANRIKFSKFTRDVEGVDIATIAKFCDSIKAVNATMPAIENGWLTWYKVEFCSSDSLLMASKALDLLELELQLQF